MIRDKIISIDNAKEIRLGSKNLISVNISNQEIYIKDLLKTKASISINEIKDSVKAFYSVYQTESKEDDDVLDKQSAIILKKLSEQNYISIVNDKCIYNKLTENYPNTEIGNLLNDSLFSDKIYPYFIEAFNIKGGEFLENYATELISKLLEKEGKTINSKNVCGGSNDNGIDGIIKSLQLIDDKGRVHRLPYNELAEKDCVKECKGLPRSYVIKKGYLKLIPAPDKEYTLKVCVSTTDLVAADNDIGRSTIEHIDDSVLADNRFCNLVILKAATFVFGRCQNPNAQIYANLYEARLATYLEHDLKTLESYRGFNRGGGHFRTDQGLLGDGGFY